MAKHKMQDKNKRRRKLDAFAMAVDAITLADEGRLAVAGAAMGLDALRCEDAGAEQKCCQPRGVEAGGAGGEAHRALAETKNQQRYDARAEPARLREPWVPKQNSLHHFLTRDQPPHVDVTPQPGAVPVDVVGAHEGGQVAVAGAVGVSCEAEPTVLGAGAFETPTKRKGGIPRKSPEKLYLDCKRLRTRAARTSRPQGNTNTFEPPCKGKSLHPRTRRVLFMQALAAKTKTVGGVTESRAGAQSERGREAGPHTVGTVMGISKVGGVTELPDRPLQEGEAIWVSIGAGSDAHTAPRNVQSTRIASDRLVDVPMRRRANKSVAGLSRFRAHEVAYLAALANAADGLTVQALSLQGVAEKVLAVQQKTMSMHTDSNRKLNALKKKGVKILRVLERRCASASAGAARGDAAVEAAGPPLAADAASRRDKIIDDVERIIFYSLTL